MGRARHEVRGKVGDGALREGDQARGLWCMTSTAARMVIGTARMVAGLVMLASVGVRWSAMVDQRWVANVQVRNIRELMLVWFAPAPCCWVIVVMTL